MRKLVSLALTLALVSLLSIPTLAIDSSGSSGNSEAVINQESSTFSVTVPTGLPVAVDKDGVITTANNAKIINNSYGPVKVSNVSVTPLNSWSIVNYGKDFSKEKIGLKEFGFILNGDEVTIDGNLELTEGSWSTISGKSELDLTYNANLGVQKVSQNIDIANVVFTVGWDSANLDFSLSSDSLSIEKGHSGKLNLSGVQTAVWSSSDEGVATVDQEGNITTLGWGTTIISATANGFTHTCEIIVPKIQIGLTMSQATATLEKGKTLQLYATSNYRDTVVWSSSNSKVAVVDSNGLVTGLSTGETVISASQGDFTVTCLVGVLLSNNENYTHGNYRYVYSITDNGWWVFIVDKTKTSYVQPLEEIYGYPVMKYNSLFSRYPNTELILEGVWTNKNVTEMCNMFEYCAATTLDLRNFNTSNVINMEGMFRDSAVTALDISSFKTHNVTNMHAMFYQSQATTLNLRGFNTSKVTDMGAMFTRSKVRILDFSNFDTSNVTNMYSMFNGIQVTILDLRSFDTSKVINMNSMFAYSKVTTGYAKTQSDVDRFNASSNKPSTLTFVVK